MLSTYLNALLRQSLWKVWRGFVYGGVRYGGVRYMEGLGMEGLGAIVCHISMASGMCREMGLCPQTLLPTPFQFFSP